MPIAEAVKDAGADAEAAVTAAADAERAHAEANAARDAILSSLEMSLCLCVFLSSVMLLKRSFHRNDEPRTDRC